MWDIKEYKKRNRQKGNWNVATQDLEVLRRKLIKVTEEEGKEIKRQMLSAGKESG